MQEAIYEFTTNLVPLFGGYYIIFQRCCRNYSIININNPGCFGVSVFETIPGPEVVATNSSPRFLNYPPIYLCKGANIGANFIATDPDGDALLYSFERPFDGGNQKCPTVSGISYLPLNPAINGCLNLTPGNSCPAVNTPSPFVQIPLIAPYTSAYPMASSPPINVNTTTGLIGGKPSMLGQWALAVKVSEYRGGVNIGTHYRDFQFNVIQCNNSVSALIQPQISIPPDINNFCYGYNITFTNSSGPNSQSLLYYWNFGNLTTLADTSNLFQPNYTYPGPGFYTVTLKAFTPDRGCVDSVMYPIRIAPELNPKIIGPEGFCFKNNRSVYFAGGSFIGNALTTYSWNFATSISPSVASIKTVSNVVFSQPGTYSIMLSVNENSCTATRTLLVQSINSPSASILTPSSICIGQSVTLTASIISQIPVLYSWSVSNNFTSTLSTVPLQYATASVYTINLKVNTYSLCIDSAKTSKSLIISNLPISNFTFSPNQNVKYFDATIFFTDVTIGNPVSWKYDFGDGNTSANQNPVHTYDFWGLALISQTVTNQYGCIHTSTSQINVMPEFRLWVPNCFTPNLKDSINPVFVPVVVGASNYVLKIYNKWGVCVFETTDYKKKWDGKYNDELMPEDVYIVYITGINLETKKDFFSVSSLLLIR